MSDILVLDNSIIIKSVNIHEDGYVEARLFFDKYLRNEIDIILPKLWLYEAGNALMYMKPRITKEKVSDLMKILLAFDLKEKAVSNIENIFYLCFEYNVTFYDAYYHALAIQENATLITADEKYYQKAKKAGYVMRLKDFK